MPVLDASALNADPEGLAFLQDVLGTGAEASAPDRRFPLEAWAPKAQAAASALDSRAAPPISPAPDRIEPRFADAAA
jgi:hypothetical protein